MIDPSSYTSQQLFEALRGTLGEFGRAGFAEDLQEDFAVLDELESRLASLEGEEVFCLSVAIIDQIRAMFGPGSRTFTAIEKRVRFAYQVWQGKYGPFSPEQAEYAEKVILRALGSAEHLTDPGHRRALVYARLDGCVNHEMIDAGFKARAARGLDIQQELAEALG